MKYENRFNAGSNLPYVTFACSDGGHAHVNPALLLGFIQKEKQCLIQRCDNILKTRKLLFNIGLRPAINFEDKNWVM